MSEPIATWELPLDACPTANQFYAGMHWSKRTKIKQQTLTRMLAQNGRRNEPLPGKVHIVATRYSSSPLDPDQATSWLKVPLDCLKVKGGLGWIADDSVKHISVSCGWEKAPPKSGKCVIQLFAEAA
jgi:hypothetical protein